MQPSEMTMEVKLSDGSYLVRRPNDDVALVPLNARQIVAILDAFSECGELVDAVSEHALGEVEASLERAYLNLTGEDISFVRPL